MQNNLSLDNIWKSLEIAVEDTLNPSSKDMRALKDKVFQLLESSNLNAVNSHEDCNLVDKKTKKKAHSIVPNENRCEALIYDLEMNDMNVLVPARCKRTMLNNSKFCKQHGAVDGTKNIDDSEHYGKEIIHEFKWGHLGTIHSPTYMFEKSHIMLLKRYNAKNKTQVDEPINENKIKKSQVKKEKSIKPKRTIANAFITFKSDNFASIKNSILSNSSNISGRDLVVAITKEASDMWKTLGEEDKIMYKQKAIANKTALTKPVMLLIESDDDHDEIVIPSVSSSDDESTLVHNPTLNVWVDTDNNLCYETKDNTASPCGQLQRGKMTQFPKKN